MTAVEIAGPVPASDIEIVWKLAQRLSDTEFVPSSLRNRPNAVLAAILTGREVGIGPMQALQSINVIQGKPTLAPELMRALVTRAGHKLEFPELTDQSCTIVGTRCDTGLSESVTWTMADAKRANLAGKGAWNTYPRAMLLARATSELCRLHFADVIAGVSYTAEEIGGEPDVPAEPEVALVDPLTGEIDPAPIDDAEVIEIAQAGGEDTSPRDVESPPAGEPDQPQLAVVDPSEGYAKWPKADLQEEARERGLPSSGTVERLVAELRAHDAVHNPGAREWNERPF